MLILNELLLLTESLKKDDNIDDVTYLRMNSGIEFLINDLETSLNSKPVRKLVIDDIAARDIANMAVVSKVDKNDITVKDGIEQEIALICRFVDYIIKEKNRELKADDMLELLKKQYELNKQIEKFYKKGKV